MTIECKVGNLYCIKEVIFKCYRVFGEGRMACHIIKPANGVDFGAWAFDSEDTTYLFEGGQCVSHRSAFNILEWDARFRSNNQHQIDRVIEP